MTRRSCEWVLLCFFCDVGLSRAPCARTNPVLRKTPGRRLVLPVCLDVSALVYNVLLATLGIVWGTGRTAVWNNRSNSSVHQQQTCVFVKESPGALTLGDRVVLLVTTAVAAVHQVQQQFEVNVCTAVP